LRQLRACVNCLSRSEGLQTLAGCDEENAHSLRVYPASCAAYEAGLAPTKVECSVGTLQGAYGVQLRIPLWQDPARGTPASRTFRRALGLAIWTSNCQVRISKGCPMTHGTSMNAPPHISPQPLAAWTASSRHAEPCHRICAARHLPFSCSMTCRPFQSSRLHTFALFQLRSILTHMHLLLPSRVARLPATIASLGQPAALLAGNL